ncbi:hypothetical protein ACFQV2_23615 [Actinokineospora soli]|uniref:Uncharacterized protein n=1 Tax=Actinokineospora soli TaxID=1048753 RepID=A0ABW2TQC6_9PSEU
MDDGFVWEDSEDAQVDVAGFAVRIDDRKTAALVAFAPDLIGNHEVGGSPVLTISTHSRTGGEAVVPPKLLRAVLPALLPRLRPPGPSVPVVHSTPLRPLRQPPGTALIDLTGHVAGSVVCTLIAEKLEVPRSA